MAMALPEVAEPAPTNIVRMPNDRTTIVLPQIVIGNRGKLQNEIGTGDIAK